MSEEEGLGLLQSPQKPKMPKLSLDEPPGLMSAGVKRWMCESVMSRYAHSHCCVGLDESADVLWVLPNKLSSTGPAYPQNHLS